MDIKTGNIIQLGGHLLLAGDSTKEEQVSELLAEHQIHLLATDPPYGVSLVASKRAFTKSATKHKEILNDHFQTDEEYRSFTKSWLVPMVPHLAKKNSAYIFGSDKMLFALRDGMQDAGFTFGQLLILAKTAAIPGRLDYCPQHELIAYARYGTHKFYKPHDKTLLFCPKPAKSPYHASTKPTSLMNRLILNSSAVGETVYDPFLGSGTTLLSAEMTGRKCIGAEIDLDHCKTIVMRWEKLTGKKAVKVKSYVKTN